MQIEICAIFEHGRDIMITVLYSSLSRYYVAINEDESDTFVRTPFNPGLHDKYTAFVD